MGETSTGRSLSSVASILNADSRSTVRYRSYAKAPVRSHRPASVSLHASAAMSSAREGNAPAQSKGGRAPKRRKHPRSVPFSSRAQPVLPSRDANGAPAASAPAKDANLLPPAPTARRVKRTFSYLVKDIGSDGNAYPSSTPRSFSYGRADDQTAAKRSFALLSHP